MPLSAAAAPWPRVTVKGYAPWRVVGSGQEAPGGGTKSRESAGLALSPFPSRVWEKTLAHCAFTLLSPLFFHLFPLAPPHTHTHPHHVGQVRWLAPHRSERASIESERRRERKGRLARPPPLSRRVAASAWAAAGGERLPAAASGRPPGPAPTCLPRKTGSLLCCAPQRYGKLTPHPSPLPHPLPLTIKKQRRRRPWQCVFLFWEGPVAAPRRGCRPQPHATRGRRWQCSLRAGPKKAQRGARRGRLP